VDDDPVARRAIQAGCNWLSESRMRGKREAALALAAEKAFDTIFLDVRMPGMTASRLARKFMKRPATARRR